MKKRTIAALGAFLFATICCSLVVLWSGSRGDEPEFKGKRLTYWIYEYSENSRGAVRGTAKFVNQEAASEAILQIGTNGIPTLLEMVGAKDSFVKTQLAGIVNTQTIIGWRIPLAREFHTKSTYGFGVLGQIAKPAVPALIEFLSDPDNDVRETAIIALGHIGPDAADAVSELVRLLDETGSGSGNVKYRSIYALGRIRSDPETVVPLLLEYLDGSNKAYRSVAAKALSRFEGYYYPQEP